MASGSGRHGGLFAFHADRLGPTRSTKGEIVVDLSRLVNRFLHIGSSHYWPRFQLEQLALDNIAIATQKQGGCSHLLPDLLKHQRDQNSARKAIVKIGRMLAVELERQGEDSGALLKFLNAVDGGGGPAAAAPLWPSLRIALQQVAIRCNMATKAGFDYGALWTIAKDALDAVNALTIAILQLPSAPIHPAAFHTPKPGYHKKWEAELKTLSKRRAKAVSVIRTSAEKLTKLLAEDRFIAPAARVWPPAAPEVARRLSSGLGVAANAARAVIAWKDNAHIGQIKQFAVNAERTLRAVMDELKRRPEVAELAYQRQVEELRAERPDWSGAEIAVKVAPAEPALPLTRANESEGKGGAGLGPTKTRKTKRGRKQLSREETQRRMGILSEWEQARTADTPMKTFCREHRPSLSVKELEKFVAWKATRDRRKAGS